MSRRGAIALLIAAGLSVLAAAAAPAPAGAAPLYRDRIVVGSDGNGAAVGGFAADPTPGERHALQGRERVRRAPRPLPAAVERLSVTVNGDQVFESAGQPSGREVALPAGIIRDGDNTPLISAAGIPRSAARARILAVPPPADGNALEAARFPTAHAAPRYVLATDPLCTPRRCAPPLSDLEVVLNDEVGLDTEESGPQRVRVTLEPPGAGDNTLLIAARGEPGAAVRVRIVALGAPEGQRLTASLETVRGLTAPLGSTKGSVREIFLPEVSDEVVS